VKVIAVNMVTVPGKPKRFGRHQVMTSPWKKGYSYLESGGKIEFFEGV